MYFGHSVHVSASEMTYIVSSGALNSTHSLCACVSHPPILQALNGVK